MKTISWIILISMFNFVSCTSSYMIKHKKDYDELNRKLEGKKVLLTLKNNEVITAENAIIGIDSSSWYKFEGDKQYRLEANDRNLITTSEIRKITIKNRINSAFGGLFAGLILGFGGSCMFYRLGVDFGLSYKDAIIGFGFMGALLGALAGHNVDYVITAQTDSISTSTSKIPSIKKIKEKIDTSVRVEISDIVDKTSSYIVVIWQGKKIYLSSSEYEHWVLTTDGKKYIVVPREVYESKFK